MTQIAHIRIRQKIICLLKVIDNSEHTPQLFCPFSLTCFLNMKSQCFFISNNLNLQYKINYGKKKQTKQHICPRFTPKQWGNLCIASVISFSEYFSTESILFLDRHRTRLNMIFKDKRHHCHQ